MTAMAYQLSREAMRRAKPLPKVLDENELKSISKSFF